MTGILNILAGSISSAIKDGYFNLVSLLLPGNGTNGAQNNTFLDSSSNAFSITRNGNTTQGTFSPFSQTGWGNYFNGSTDYLSVANATALQLSNEFTVEAWYYPISFPGAGSYHCLVINGNNQSSSNALGVFIKTSGGIQIYNFAANSAIFDTASGVVLNSWNHIAVTRNSSNSVNLWLNGVSQGAAVTVSNSFSSTSATLIGASNIIGTGISQYANGYISNLRITKGGALYTSNFTPSTTPLTTTVSAGTVSLLICQDNRFRDASSNAFTITVSGTPSVQAFSPFAPTAAYSAATNGGSGYFDGTGDYLTVADSTALDLTADYTIELWFYPNVTGGLQRLFMVGDYRSTFNGIDLYTNGSSQLVFYSNGASVITGGTVVPYSWNHVALVRSGSGSNNTTLYLNGASVGQATNTTSFTGVTGNGASIGYEYSGTGTSITTAMYVAGARLVNGSAVYTAAFTPPTVPPTAITNTQLLLNFTNAGITDATGKNVLETVGNAQISTTQSKFGGSSIYLDGTGDKLVIPSNPALAFGSGNFTIEFWLYLNSTTGDMTLYDARTTDPQVVPVIYMTGGQLRYYVTTTRITGATLSTGVWYHIALSRSGTSTMLFLNGVQTGSTYSDSNVYLQTPVTIGAYGPTTANVLNGYISDMRVTTGFARYTGNFTPPTSLLQNQ